MLKFLDWWTSCECCKLWCEMWCWCTMASCSRFQSLSRSTCHASLHRYLKPCHRKFWKVSYHYLFTYSQHPQPKPPSSKFCSSEENKKKNFWEGNFYLKPIVVFSPKIVINLPRTNKKLRRRINLIHVTSFPPFIQSSWC